MGAQYNNPLNADNRVKWHRFVRYSLAAVRLTKLLAAGMMFNILVYVRNLWFIHRKPAESAGGLEI